MTPSDRITQHVARAACEAVATRAIRVFQKMPAIGAIGDDHGLKSLWEEMCCVLREAESGNWAYDGCVAELTRTTATLLNELERHEKCAIWLETDAGYEWESDIGNECEPDALAYCEEDVVEYIVRKYLMGQAVNWTNGRIRRLDDQKYDPADLKWESSLFRTPDTSG
jgi:hypothetical protein